jgi:hypothetical protein
MAVAAHTQVHHGAGVVMEGSLSKNSTAMEKMPVLMPMPRPSESSAVTTRAGLRRRLRIP